MLGGSAPFRDGQVSPAATNPVEMPTRTLSRARAADQLPAPRWSIGLRVARLYLVAAAIAVIPVGGMWAYYFYSLAFAFNWDRSLGEFPAPQIALGSAVILSVAWVAILADCTHKLARKWGIDPWGAALYGALVGGFPGFLLGMVPVVGYCAWSLNR